MKKRGRLKVVRKLLPAQPWYHTHPAKIFKLYGSTARPWKVEYEW